MDKRFIIGLLITVIMLYTALNVYFNVYSNRNVKEQVNENKNIKNVNLTGILSNIKTPNAYTIVKEESIGNKTRNITVKRKNNNVYILLNDTQDLYVVEYTMKNNQEQLCFSFNSKGCGNLSELSIFYYLPNEEQARFIYSSLPLIIKLEQGNALHITNITDNGKCVNYSYNYSYAELPLKDLRDLGLDKASIEQISTVYKESLCIKDNFIMAFSRDDGISKASWEILSIDKNEPAIPDLSNETDINGAYNSWRLFKQAISQQNISDPQIRSIATEFGKPEICFKASDKNTCLLIFAQKLKTNESCDLIDNETLKFRCFDLIKNISK